MLELGAAQNAGLKPAPTVALSHTDEATGSTDSISSTAWSCPVNFHNDVRGRRTIPQWSQGRKRAHRSTTRWRNGGRGRFLYSQLLGELHLSRASASPHRRHDRDWR